MLAAVAALPAVAAAARMMMGLTLGMPVQMAAIQPLQGVLWLVLVLMSVHSLVTAAVAAAAAAEWSAAPAAAALEPPSAGQAPCPAGDASAAAG